MGKKLNKVKGPEFSAQLSMEGEVATLTVAGCIGWDTEAVEFTDKVKAAKESGATKLVVRINSLGGYCYDGLAMGDCLKNCGMETRGEVYGTAQSMASYLLQCCDVRTAHEHATLMFHQPTAGVYGTVDELLEQAQYLVKMRDKMFEDMAARCGTTGPELSAEHMTMKIYSAADALAKGFLDSIEGGENEQAAETEKPEPELATARGGLMDYGVMMRLAMMASEDATDKEDGTDKEDATDKEDGQPEQYMTRAEVAEMIAKAKAEAIAAMGAPVTALPGMAGAQGAEGGNGGQYTMEELDAMPAMQRMAVLSTNPRLAARYAKH